MNIEALVQKYANLFYEDNNECVTTLLGAALTEQAEAFKGELQSYDGMVRELTKTVEDMRAAQSMPVVGEPTDAAYKWMIANGAEPMTSLHKLGERLAAFLDEDQFSEGETLLLTAITAINTFVPVPAAELATLREKAAEADELRKDAARGRLLVNRGEWIRYNDGQDKPYALLGIRLPYDADLSCKAMCENAIDAAIAQERGK